MTVTDVEKALSTGKTAETLATEKGVSATDFKTKLDAKKKEEMNAKLATDVASGKMTQVQADALKNKMTSHSATGKHTVSPR